MMTTSEKLALSVGEAAHAVSMSRATFYKRIKSGDVRAVRSGGRTLILRRDLEAFLASLETAAA